MEPITQEKVSLDDIMANIKSAITKFEGENKRFPTKAFLGKRLFKRLIHAEKLKRANIKLTRRVYETFRLNEACAIGIEFYEQGKFLREEIIDKGTYQDILKTIGQIKLPLILAAPRWGKKLTYVESYELGVSKTSHTQAY